MKILLSLLLPVVFAGGAVATPMIAAEQTMTNTAYMSGQSQNGINKQKKKKGLLEEEEEVKNLSAMQKLNYYLNQQAQTYAELLILQASLDELLARDITNYTEEELVAYNAQIAELETQIADFEALKVMTQLRMQLTEGIMAREQFQTRKQLQYNNTAEEIFAEKTFSFYEKAAGLQQGELYKNEMHMIKFDEQITQIETQLATLYETDTTTYTEEELTAYYAEIDALETSLVELNESMLQVSKRSAMTQKMNKVKATIRISETLSNQYRIKYGIQFLQN